MVATGGVAGHGGGLGCDARELGAGPMLMHHPGHATEIVLEKVAWAPVVSTGVAARATMKAANAAAVGLAR